MRKVLCILILASLLLIISIPVCASELQTLTGKSINLDEIDQTKIDKMVNDILKKSKIPGASVILINEKQTKYLTYGSGDKEAGSMITGDTLFALGSMSKAYTAIGILLLENEGKLSLDDPISKYIPWFKVHYKGEYEGQKIDQDLDLKLSNFLYHTSGIPFKTIGDIPEGNTDDMLEKTVETLIDEELDFYPGTKYQYATINYNVLALVIQNITGQLYEEFMNENVFTPLELNNTYVYREESAVLQKIAKGYKISFFHSKPYDAPVYRGNTAAGYIISNSTDMERWMRIQMALVDVPPKYQEIIEKSHIGDTTVASQGDYYYASGWNVHVRGEDINHGGSDPNYSSMLIMKPNVQLGICVLTNMNSNAADYIASNVLNIIEGKSVNKYQSDTYKRLDTIFSWVTIGSIVLGILFLVLFVVALIEAAQKKRNHEKVRGAKVAGILLAVPLMLFCGFCIYYLPNILMQRLPWEAVIVWGSESIYVGCILGFVAALIFMSYVVFTFNFPKKNEKNYIALVPLTVINGLVSALIIFTINESFNRNLEYSKELLVYFTFSLLFFVYTIKLVQGKLIIITNEMAYEKRINMIDKIMCSSYQAIEAIGQKRIFSGLNNDTNAVSQIPGVVISFASNLLTLLFCLSYLLSKSVYAFVASMSIILINGSLSVYTSKRASKYWEKNRDIQDTYFGQISDLVYGFKELVLNKLRRYTFWLDMKHYSKMSVDLEKAASLKVLNFNIYNTLMYNIVFGVVVFVFPLLIFDISVNDLRENLFIVFYMIGPFGALANAIPRLLQLKVNLNRIDLLINDLEEVSTGYETVSDKSVAVYTQNVSLKLQHIVYKYNLKEEDKDDVEFALGPISAEFKTGEITFITGGNGSGKSTLGKLITGLYKPQQGSIVVNGSEYELKDINECFSAIYSDFHLFKKLYGIDYQNKKEQVDKYLDAMKLGDKVHIDNSGEFESLDLSTGQKKRLAFVVSCLEDKPMMLFDEWAAEQDPEFRHYFYTEILPMLKASGKGVIVITHDDRYFETADNLLKLERGCLVEKIAR